MELLVDGLEPHGVDVGIDLRRGDTGVAKHFLKLPQVGSPRQQVRGKAVSQRVRAHVGRTPAVRRTA